jgi:acrylyl-CoA reductase (NADPH)
MPDEQFRALVLRQTEGRMVAEIEMVAISDLPPGDVTVAIEYSDINYKDRLAITGTGHRQVVQSFPMVPGIDFAGVVEESASPQFKPGDRVLLTGWGVGEKWWGGHAEKARVKADWLVHLPDEMTARQCHGLWDRWLYLNALRRSA